jgi:hypothetical protein
MLVVVALLWVLGVAQFSRALDPTGSQENGVDLPLANARLDGSGDWLTAGSMHGIQVTSRGVAINGPPGGAVLYSRRVPVFPHDCYTLTVAGSSGARSLAVQVVADDHTTPLSPSVRLEPRAASTRLTFSPHGTHAVMVVFSTAGRAARGMLTDARLRRVESC